MADAYPLADLSIQELLARIGSIAVSPGAGVAGAIALALATACARKATSISLKHRPEDAELQTALATFAAIEREALADGERDAQAFSLLVHERSPAAVDRLIGEEERLGELIDRLRHEIDVIAPRIRANMTGDIVAAKALADAAQRIRMRNEAETLKLR
jgi:hypothetical protein